MLYGPQDFTMRDKNDVVVMVILERVSDLQQKIF